MGLVAPPPEEDEAVEDGRVEGHHRGEEREDGIRSHGARYRPPARVLDPARIVRMRGFLALALVAAVAYAISRVFLGHPRPAAPLTRLTRREAAFVDAAAETLFPPGGEVPPSGRDAGIPLYVDGYVKRVPRNIARLMRLLFFLVEHATLFFPAPGGLLGGGMRRFSALDAAQREAVLEGWRTSRLFPRRLVFTSLRAILTLGYFADPAVLRALGLAPYDLRSPVCEADLLYPRVGALPETIRLGRGDLTPPSDGTPIPLDAPLHPAFAAREGAPR
jgi:hypothetical protein